MVRGISEEAHAAQRRILDFLEKTPLTPFEAGVWLKREDLQKTGSFKARGVFSAVTALSPERRARGIVAASTGNHGLATALALRTFRIPGRIFVPQSASAAKVAKVQAALLGLSGASLETAGATCEAAEAAARRHVLETKQEYVSPYNDPQVVAGQGTVAIELLEQMSAPLDAVIVAVGGGGLIGGIGAVLKTHSPQTRIVAASPENDCAMYHSLTAGEIVDLPALPTLSDGTAGGVEPGSLTFPLCREVIDEFVLVKENEIQNALDRFERGGIRAEGAAGVALAAYLGQRERFRGASVAVVVCGGNR